MFANSMEASPELMTKEVMGVTSQLRGPETMVRVLAFTQAEVRRPGKVLSRRGRALTCPFKIIF